jgi:hypothetical protein
MTEQNAKERPADDCGDGASSQEGQHHFHDAIQTADNPSSSHHMFFICSTQGQSGNRA